MFRMISLLIPFFSWNCGETTGEGKIEKPCDPAKVLEEYRRRHAADYVRDAGTSDTEGDAGGVDVYTEDTALLR